MPWASKLLRGDRVWVRINPRGEPAAGPDGRVDVRYRPGGKVYRASTRNLSADPAPEVLSDAKAALNEGGSDLPVAAVESEAVAAPATAKAPRPKAAAKPRVDATAGVPKDAIVVYTDGACTGNPGPMGIGAVILDEKNSAAPRREVSEYLGEGTNNIAELTAILRALELCPHDRPVLVHSDSSYALGLLGKGWKAKANQELVAELRKVAAKFEDLRLIKVAGHAGVPENERCDELARAAVVRRR